MTPEANDLKDLILTLAQQYHGGAVYPMGARTGLSPAILDRWAHGAVKTPSLTSIDKLCKAYRLDFLKVLTIIRRSRTAMGAMLLFSVLGMPALTPPRPVGALPDGDPRMASVVCIIRSRDRHPWTRIVCPTVEGILTRAHLLVSLVAFHLFGGSDGYAQTLSRRPACAGARA